MTENVTDKYTLEKDYGISVAETECSRRVKPVVLFNYMQDLAEKSIAMIDDNFSCEGLLNRGCGWFLIRYRIEFENNPAGLSSIRVKTESRGVQKSTFYRDFEIYDNKSGERILRAVSSWLIVNLNKKSIVNIEKEFPDFLQFTPRDNDLKLNRLKPPETITREKMFEIRYDDLDINNHVNNTVYITWALETQDYDFRKSHAVKAMDIYYKHDVKYGEPVVSQMYFDEGSCTSEHVIKNASTGEVLCLLNIEYKKV